MFNAVKFYSDTSHLLNLDFVDFTKINLIKEINSQEKYLLVYSLTTALRFPRMERSIQDRSIV